MISSVINVKIMKIIQMTSRLVLRISHKKKKTYYLKIVLSIVEMGDIWDHMALNVMTEIIWTMMAVINIAK